MLKDRLQRLTRYNPFTLDPAHLLIAGVALVLVSGAPFIVRYLEEIPRHRIEGRADLRPKQAWDFMLFEDRPEECHLLRLQPEGMSVTVRRLKDNLLLRQANFFTLRDPSVPEKPLRFTSASYSLPLDLDGAGALEALVTANDSTSSYLITYGAGDSARILYRADGPPELADSLWQGSLEVRGAADFGRGKRVVATLITRYQGDPRRVIVLDPATGRVEASWDLGAAPKYRFGFLPPGNGHKSGFYLTTQATCNGNAQGGLADSLGYLLTFHCRPDGWDMEVTCADALVHGRSLDARPVSLPSGPGWLVANSDTCFILNQHGERVSNAFYGNTNCYSVEAVFDRDGDGFTDQALVCGWDRIYLLKISPDGHLQIILDWVSPRPFVNFSQQRIFLQHDASGRITFLACVTQDWVLRFINAEGRQIGAIPLPEFTPAAFPSATEHGRQLRGYLRPGGSADGLFIYGGFGQVAVVNYQAAINPTSAGGLILAGLFALGMLLSGGSAARLLRLRSRECAGHREELAAMRRELDQSRGQEARRAAAHELAVKVFRRRPTDANLYLEHYLNDQWPALQEKVEAVYSTALDDLKRPVPHDSIREEVGIPLKGQDRLINLLALRRITLHFLAQGAAGNELMQALNFTIDPKYDRLIRDARAILAAAQRNLEPGRTLKLSETGLKPVLAELEKSRVIPEAAAPRRLSGELSREADGALRGSLKLVQGGREIQLLIHDGQITHAWHSNLSPAFSEYLALLGLSAETPVSEQLLFPEEQAWLGSLQ
ncbi:MAG: hypothetical protein C4524_11910 [Candidatus Zixiibacteriota bacterium]|nr:MAG: hypothetical protein C4524_11910 [candidate division Zixibacteria bacterium]